MIRTVQDVIETLREHEIELYAEGNSLGYRAPAGVVTEELKEILREHKEEILAVLSPSIEAIYYEDDQERWYKTVDARFWLEDKQTGIRTELVPGNPPEDEPLPPGFFQALGALLGYVITRRMQ